MPAVPLGMREQKALPFVVSARIDSLVADGVMRLPVFAFVSVFISSVVPSAFAGEIGLPADRFVASWTALSTARFTPTAAAFHTRRERVHAVALDDKTLVPLLDDAFASAADNRIRRDITLNEMMTAWDQPKRSAFQRLREAEAVYAGADDARQARFVAALTDVVDGTGRSAAIDGSAAAALGGAYHGALSRAGDARAATEATQKAWMAYRDAFASFADRDAPGSAAYFGAMLDRQRTSELGAQ